MIHKSNCCHYELTYSEIKNTILQIKFDVPDGVQIPGIEIYHVVFVGGVCNYEELK